ncbi:hypothetical protein FHS42_007464 [Streptomyces zagrosensis]|uniref:Uncharacterized protein n=1 Tax=Streptomyces zagrosensis TaxID=1042984 RepID=A0A7W9V3J5_9ACTN|nr:hypothetical protein [Streptomyces zagrosensis]
MVGWRWCRRCLAVGQHADLVWERTCGKIDAVMLLA